jgi:hypothetical protein
MDPLAKRLVASRLGTDIIRASLLAYVQKRAQS